MGFVKNVVRGGLILGLVAGVAIAVTGPVRARILMDKARQNIHSAVDGLIDDPAALRAQIRELEAQYAPKIAAVRTDLADLRQQVAQLNREKQVCDRVIDLAQTDLGSLQTMLARANDVRDSHASFTSAASLSTDEPVAQSPELRLNFNHESLSLDQAYAKAGRVENVITGYTGRSADIERDLGFMGEQEKRLAELLDKLEGERGDFQAQLWQLDHQIDAIARNGRLITIMEKRQDTIDRHSRYEAGSLENLKGRLAEMRTKQEAQLETLGKGSTSENYENKAKIDLDARNKYGKSRIFIQKPAKTPVIEIGPGDCLTPGSIPQVEQADPVQHKPAKSSTVAMKR